MNFAEREIARIIVNTGKFVKNSGLILIEETTTQNVYYRLSYLISYLLFRKKGLLIFKGGLSGMRYRTLLTRPESWKTKFTSVRPKYLSDRGEICISRNSSSRAILWTFFRFFVFSLLHGLVEN